MSELFHMAAGVFLLVVALGLGTFVLTGLVLILCKLDVYMRGRR